jgi:small subunit ribosomal protein S1
MSTDDENDFAALLEEYDSQGRGPRVGDVVIGKVVSVAADAVFVDLGGKSEGMLEMDQVTDAEGNVEVKMGDSVEARVVDLGGRTGCITLRRHLGKGPDAKDELQQAFDHQMPVEGVVMATNKGGFEVQIAGLRAFCPVSQIDTRFVEHPEEFVNQRFQFRITKFEGGKRPNVIVSRRALLEEEAAATAAELRGHLAVGLVLSGQVSSIKDYGAFVDIGGIEGMLHISELGHSRVTHPSDVLVEGQKLEVQIIKIEKTGDARRPEKIGLSLKSMEKDPWNDVADQFPAGTKTTGTVMRTEAFGAFVEIAPGIEGLVHISEIAAGRRIKHPREVVEIGARVEVSVLSVEAGQRRISLSMAAVSREHSEAEERENIERHAPKSEGLGTFADLLKDKLE